jgi:hypothetical protein
MQGVAGTMLASPEQEDPIKNFCTPAPAPWSGGRTLSGPECHALPLRGKAFPHEEAAQVAHRLMILMVPVTLVNPVKDNTLARATLRIIPRKNDPHGLAS